MSQYEPLYDSFSRNVQERFVPATRMSVSPSVYLPNAEIDFLTGQLKPDRQRRRRTQGKRLEAERLEREQKRLEESVRREMSKGGVRISVRAGILVMALVLFFCGVTVLYHQGQIVQRQKDINRLEKEIAHYRVTNEELQTQIAEASDAAVICYYASQNLGMVPAQSVAAIHLTAADTRPTVQTAPATQDKEVVMIAMETPNTPVPAIASGY